MEDFVTYELSVKLKEKGFNEKCLFAYNDERIINPKIVEEYGDLTDDGYYELTKEGGGKLKFDNVYIYEQQIILRDKIIINRNFIDAPTISQVLKWLREENEIHFEFVAAAYGYNVIISQTPEAGGTDYYFTHMNDDGPNDGGAWDRYEDAALYCIEYVLDNLI